MSKKDTCSECGKEIVYDEFLNEWWVTFLDQTGNIHQWFWCSGKRVPHIPQDEVDKAIRSIQGGSDDRG